MRHLRFACLLLTLHACESDPHVDRADSSLDAPETREASVGSDDAGLDAGD